MPRKNIIDFLGKPMIAYSIEAAIQTGLFCRIVVSTEDEEIADISSHFGAEIDYRPPALANDVATVSDVCIDLLYREQAHGREYDLLCILYATAPMRNARDIKNVMCLIEPDVCDYAMAVTHFVQPPYQALSVEKNHWAKPLWPEMVFLREADIGHLCIDNGSTYAVSVPAFRQSKAFYHDKMRVYFMPRERSVDINTQEDVELALYYARRAMV